MGTAIARCGMDKDGLNGEEEARLFGPWSVASKELNWSEHADPL